MPPGRPCSAAAAAAWILGQAPNRSRRRGWQLHRRPRPAAAQAWRGIGAPRLASKASGPGCPAGAQGGAARARRRSVMGEWATFGRFRGLSVIGCIRAAAASSDGATAGAQWPGARGGVAAFAGTRRRAPASADGSGQQPPEDGGPGPGSRLAPPARWDHDAGIDDGARRGHWPGPRPEGRVHRDSDWGTCSRMPVPTATMLITMLVGPGGILGHLRPASR